MTLSSSLSACFLVIHFVDLPNPSFRHPEGFPAIKSWGLTSHFSPPMSSVHRLPIGQRFFDNRNKAATPNPANIRVLDSIPGSRIPVR